MEYQGKYVDLRPAGAASSVFEAQASDEVGGVFSVPEWLVIHAEIEDF